MKVRVWNSIKNFQDALSLLKVDNCEIQDINPYNPQISTLQENYCKKEKKARLGRLFKIIGHQLEYKGSPPMLSLRPPHSTESEVMK